MDWKRMLAYITGSVEQELLRRNEYLIAENRILRVRLKGRVRMSDEERRSLAEVGKRLGRRALAEVATLVKPETILAWHRRLVALKFDGSRHRQGVNRPPEILLAESRMNILTVRPQLCSHQPRHTNDARRTFQPPELNRNRIAAAVWV